MAEKRKSQRHRVLKLGTIVYNSDRSTASCTLRNVSAGGALIKMESTLGLPSEFRLRFDGQMMECRSVRRTLGEIGVAFTSLPASAG